MVRMVLALFLFFLTNLSSVNAEIQTYNGTGEYIMSDFETPDIAKQRAKARAEQHAVEQAGVYVKSYTRTVNSIVTEDEIIAIANTIIKITNVDYVTTPINDKGGSFRIVANIQATVDSNRIDEWMKRGTMENERLVEENKRLQEEKIKQDKEIAELRKKLANVTTTQEKRNLEQKVLSIDNNFLSNQKLKEGIRLYAEKKYVNAVSVLSEAISFNGNNLEAYAYRAEAYAEQGKYHEALIDSNKAVEINPKNKFVYFLRGAVYFRQVKSQEAMFDFNKAIELDPKFSLAYFCRGGVYIMQKKWQQAAKDFTIAIELNPKDARSYHFRGIVYGKLGNKELSNRDLAKAKELGYKS